MEGVLDIRLTFANHGDSLGLVEPSKVEEVRFLMVFIEYGTRAVFQVIGSKDCDAVSWEFLGESSAAVMILESWNSRCQLSGLEQMRMRFV